MVQLLTWAHCESCPHCQTKAEAAGQHKLCKMAGRQIREMVAHQTCPIGRGDDKVPTYKSGGPGTELKKLFATFTIAPGDCACDDHANEMDFRGPEWCEANIETIVGWLRESATKQSLPFAAFIARAAVRRAIRTARKAL